MMISKRWLAHEPGGQAPRIGMCRTPQWAQADADTQAAWSVAAAALSPQAAELAEVALPDGLGDLIELQKQVMAFETARALSNERVHHRDRLSERLRTLLDEGLAMAGADHTARLIRRAQARHSVGALFDRWDVLLAPSATGEAPAGLTATGDPVFCRTWTLLGLPCVHLPFARGAVVWGDPVIELEDTQEARDRWAARLTELEDRAEALVA